MGQLPLTAECVDRRRAHPQQLGDLADGEQRPGRAAVITVRRHPVQQGSSKSLLKLAWICTNLTIREYPLRNRQARVGPQSTQVHRSPWLLPLPCHRLTELLGQSWATGRWIHPQSCSRQSLDLSDPSTSPGEGGTGVPESRGRSAPAPKFSGHREVPAPRDTRPQFPNTTLAGRPSPPRATGPCRWTSPCHPPRARAST